MLTGEVVVTETFILRQTPNSVVKLLRAVINAGGDLTIDDATRLLETSQGVVFNISRDLKVLGVFSDRPRHVHVADEIQASADKEEAIRERVASSIQKNKVFAVLKELALANDGFVTHETLAAALPRAFPAIKVNKKVWGQYARKFTGWLDYAGLALRSNQGVELPPPATAVHNLLTDEKRQYGNRGSRTGSKGRIFPSSPPGPALRIVKALVEQTAMPEIKITTQQKALADLSLLGIVKTPKPNVFALAINPIDESGSWRSDSLLKLMEEQDVLLGAIKLLRKKTTITNSELGHALQEGYQAEWSEETKRLMGKTFRAWARSAGIVTARRASPSPKVMMKQKEDDSSPS